MGRNCHRQEGILRNILGLLFVWGSMCRTFLAVNRNCHEEGRLRNILCCRFWHILYSSSPGYYLIPRSFSFVSSHKFPFCLSLI